MNFCLDMLLKERENTELSNILPRCNFPLSKQVRGKCEVFTGVGCSPGMGLYVSVPVPPPNQPEPQPQPPQGPSPCSGSFILECDGHPFR